MAQDEVLFVNPRRLTLIYLPRSIVLPSVQFIFAGIEETKFKIDEPSFRAGWSLLKQLFEMVIDSYSLHDSEVVPQFTSLFPLKNRFNSNKLEIVEAFSRLLDIRYWCICESGAYSGLPGGWDAIPKWKKPSTDSIINIRSEMKKVANVASSFGKERIYRGLD